MKETLRIASFSLGGLLAVIGILLLAGVFIQAREDKHELRGGAAIAALLLIGGIGICALAPRRRQLPTSVQMMSREEKAIQNIREHMKKRRLRIGLFAALFVAMLSCLVFTLWETRKLDAMVTPEYFHSANTFDDPGEAVPILLSAVYILAGAKAKILFFSYWFAAWTGFSIALLIVELAGLTKPELTLAMWEKTQRLEKEIRDLQKRG